MTLGKGPVAAVDMLDEEYLGVAVEFPVNDGSA